MNKTPHELLREQAREYEQHYRDEQSSDNELADRELRIIGACNTIDDLAGLIKQLCSALGNHEHAHPARKRAMDFLAAKQLVGSPLRADAAEKKLAQGTPVAWVRKWAFEGEKPAKVKGENGLWRWPGKFKLHPVTLTRCFDDDVPLYAVESMAEPAQLAQLAGWMWQHEETGRTGFVDAWQVQNGFEKNNPRCKLVSALYGAPVDLAKQIELVAKNAAKANAWFRKSANVPWAELGRVTDLRIEFKEGNKDAE